MSCCYKCLWPDPADKVPGSGKVNKVWDFLGCLSLLLDRGDKCKDLEPGDPPPAEAEEVLRRITGGTGENNLSFYSKNVDFEPILHAKNIDSS